MIIQNNNSNPTILNTANINKYLLKNINFKGIKPLTKDVFEKHNTKNIKIDYGTLNYGKDNKFIDFTFDKPQNLKDTFQILKHIEDTYKISKYGLLTYSHIYKSFVEDFEEKFKDMKFVRFLGVGNNAIALENTEGKVLKLTSSDTFEFRGGKEDFDANIFEVGKGKRFYYYIQEKCSKENLSQSDVDTMSKMIEEKGYTAFDMSTDQIGFNSSGKLCLIDPECARNDKLYQKKQKEISEWLTKHGIDEDYI